MPSFTCPFHREGEGDQGGPRLGYRVLFLKQVVKDLECAELEPARPECKQVKAGSPRLTGASPSKGPAVCLCHGDSWLLSLAVPADRELRETRDQVWLLHNLARPPAGPRDSLWDAPGFSFSFSLDPLGVKDAGSEGIVLSRHTSAQSAGEKQEAFLPTGPQHGVSKLVILRKGQRNQPPCKKRAWYF